jgi:hypothetical protein
MLGYTRGAVGSAIGSSIELGSDVQFLRWFRNEDLGLLTELHG